MDLTPCNTSASLREIIIRTLEDMQRLYPGIIPSNKVPEIEQKSIDEGLAYFCKALKSVAEFWLMNNDWMDRRRYEIPSCKDDKNIRQLGETVLATLDCLTKIANEKSDVTDEDDQRKDLNRQSISFREFLLSSPSFSDRTLSSRSSPPVTPASVLPELTESDSSSQLFLTFRVQSVRKLNPIDVKRLSFHMYSPHMEILSKTEEEASGDKMTMDDESCNAEKITSEALVLDLDTAEELQIKNGSHRESDKSHVVADLGKPLSPKSVQSASPSVSPTLAPPPPPPPLLVPQLQPKTASVGMPPPPPPELPQGLGLGSAALPPPPPLALKVESVLAPPPPMLRENGVAPPPPPPIGAGKSLRARATTKLKRSNQIGNLYRTLKGKVEGTILLHGKSFRGKKSAIGASDGRKQGMADALAEMTKRSSYFQQIEEDVQNYSVQITELSSSITNFETKKMPELIKFHKDVESFLENLSDESQVLSRFEGFPTKKLEAIRMAAALYNKLDSILIELQNWKIEPPLDQLLDKVERYFNKSDTQINRELDALDRTKDEESKKFKSYNIEFDFYYLVKIKEAVVDVSSSCMELVLKERREKRESASRTAGKEWAKMLWRAFQFAFRVYTFAGGHDDRADKLTVELAQEIESEPHPP